MSWIRTLATSFLEPITPYLLAIFFLGLAFTFFDSSRGVLLLIPKAVYVVFGLQLTMALVCRVYLTQTALSSMKNGAVQTLTEVGWTEADSKALSSVLSGVSNSEFFSSVSSVQLSSIQVFNRGPAWFWFGEESVSRPGPDQRIQGSNISYLVVTVFKEYPEAVFLGAFGARMKQVYYSRLGFKQTRPVEGFVEVMSKTGVLDPREIAISSVAIKISAIRTAANSSLKLGLDDNPDLEFHPSMVVIRFVGPLNPQFIRSLEELIAEFK